MVAINDLTEAIIGAAIEVSKRTGAGLLESAYETCLCRELTLRNIPFRRQVQLPIVYKGEQLDCGYRIDILVDERVVIEVKSVKEIESIHVAQVLTYLRLGGWQVGLIINFNVEVLRLGLKRVVNNFIEPTSATSAPLR
jgi:GxxExxY protein